VFAAIVILATLALVCCAAAAWFTPSKIPLLAILFFLPIANIYIGGVGFFLGLLAMTVVTTASETDLRHARWFFIIWAVWLFFSMIGLLSMETSWRQLMQAVEFVFYGVLAWQVTTICRTDDRLFASLMMAGICGCTALALVAIFAAAISIDDWPSGLLGRNETAFVIVTIGLIPALYLVARPTWLVRLPPIRFPLIIVIGLFLTTTIFLNARAATATSVLLIVYAAAFRVFRRRAISAAVFGAITGLAVLAATAISGALIQNSDLSTSFSNLERLGLLQASARLFLEKPMLGWGWGTIDLLIPEVPETILSYPHPHNALAHFAIELGAFGVILFLLLAFRPMARALALSRRGYQSEAVFCVSASACIFLLGMTDVIFYGASRAIPAVVLLAMVEAMPFRSFVVLPLNNPTSAVPP